MSVLAGVGEMRASGHQGLGLAGTSWGVLGGSGGEVLLRLFYVGIHSSEGGSRGSTRGSVARYTTWVRCDTSVVHGSAGQRSRHESRIISRKGTCRWRHGGAQGGLVW